MNLRDAMAEKGLSNEGLSALTGMPAGRIASYKSGGRGLGSKSARKIAEHVGRPPEELVGESAVKRYERAKAAGDRDGVFRAVKSVLNIVSKSEVDEATEAGIDELMDDACKFLEESSSGVGVDDAPLDADGRDPAGVRRAPLAQMYDEESGDYDDEGRDARGVRIAPMKEID